MTKRIFSVLRQKILVQLSSGQQSVNQIASGSGINWKSVDRHVSYLRAEGLVKCVFSHPSVKVFEITNAGRVIMEREFE